MPDLKHPTSSVDDELDIDKQSKQDMIIGHQAQATTSE